MAAGLRQLFPFPNGLFADEVGEPPDFEWFHDDFVRLQQGYLHSKFGHRKLDAILNFFHKWGTSALAVSTAVPIPMPTSMLFAAAGASDYGVGRFLTVVIICRSVRYTFIAIVADHYGRHFVRVLRHPSQYWGWLLLFAAVIFSLIMAGILLNRRLTAANIG